MMINIDNVSDYLLEKRIIDIEVIVNGDLRLIDVSRKNRNVKVLRKNGTSLLMKQPNIGDRYSKMTIQREARLYQIVNTTKELSNIKSIIPRFLGFDSPTNILTIEFVDDVESLTEYYYNTSLDKFPTEPSFRLGNMMATYHRAFESWIDNERFSFFPKSYPFPFFIARPGPEVFSNVSRANLQLLKIIQRYPDVSNHLSNLHKEWKIQTLIHGDMKWDNLIIKFANDPNAPLEMKIVDWELCDIGDPGWDIGAALQDFISFWIFSLPITGNENPEQLIRSTEHPLQSMKEAIRAFWHGYTKGAGIKGIQANELLYKSAKYCAARLIHKAYESQQTSSQLLNIAIYMLQVSVNILNDIDNSIVQLFGIPFSYEKDHES